MAEQNTEIIFKVGTDQAVKNIADLKENVKQYKKQLDELTIGTEEYTETLGLLQESQAALKNAMHASSLEGETQEERMQQLAKQAKGLGTSYNALVKQMADLKEEFRSTEDAARRADLGKQINEINQQLKDMDAMKGDFGRNVGDYFNQVTAPLEKTLHNLPSGLNALKGPLDDTTKSLKLMGQQPILGIAGLLAPIIIKITESLKDNKNVTDALKKVMQSLEPVMDILQQAIEKIADWLVKIIDWVSPFIPTIIEGMKNIVVGAVGVGNAILQFLLTPVRTVISAVKGLGNTMSNVFKGQFKEAAASAKTAIDGIGDALKKGFSFATNFEEGKKVGEQFIAGLEATSTKKKAKDAGKAVGKEARDGFMEELDKLVEEVDRQMESDFAAWEKAQDDANKRAEQIAKGRLDSIDKAAAHQKELNTIMAENERERADKEYAIQAAANEKKLALLDQFMKDALARGDYEAYLAREQERADLEVEIEMNALREKKRLRELDAADEKKRQEDSKARLEQTAAATSGIMGTLADMIESGTEVTEKEARRAKALRIASATIDMYQGATTAYSTAQSLGVPMGPIVGAINAAAVVATGLQNIAKIKSQNVSASASASGSPAPAVAPPSITPQVSQVRTITSASEEDRLNQMASDQRVYILNSDLEAAANSRRVLATETSF